MPSENDNSVYVKRKVQVIVFTRQPDLLVLMLRRPIDRDHIWQPVTGNVDDSDTSFKNTARRELVEETGIVNLVEVIDMNFDFQFKKGTARILERLIAAEIRAPVPIVLSSEHVDYAWLSPDDAVERLEWKSNKEGVRRVISEVSGERAKP